MEERSDNLELQIFRSVNPGNLQSISEGGTVLAVGKFDGVHYGHKHLLSQLTSAARLRGHAGGAIIFDPSPGEILNPSRAVPPLMSPAERVERLLATGLDFVVVMAFTRSLASMTAAEFLTALKRQLKVRVLVMGPDNTIGRDRVGLESACALAQQFDIEVLCVEPFNQEEGATLSATSIRDAISGGRVREAVAKLGRAHRMPGIADTVGALSDDAEDGASYVKVRIQETIAQPPPGQYSGWIAVNGIGHTARIDIDDEGWAHAATFGLAGDLAAEHVSVGLEEESA